MTYKLVLRGDIKSVTIGRCRRVPLQALEDFVKERLAETDQKGKTNGSAH